MIDINKEAEEYAKQFDYPEDSAPSTCFIAGANSKYVKEQIIQAKIDVLDNCLADMYLYSSFENGFEQYSDAYYNLENSYKKSLNKLREELKQLQDE